MQRANEASRRSRRLRVAHRPVAHAGDLQDELLVSADRLLLEDLGERAVGGGLGEIDTVEAHAVVEQAEPLESVPDGVQVGEEVREPPTAARQGSE